MRTFSSPAGSRDKVALSCPNLPQFTAIYFGILKAGAVVVPLNVLLKGREVAYHRQDSDAKAYCAFEPDVPARPGQLVIGEAAAGLDHGHPVALLGQT